MDALSGKLLVFLFSILLGQNESYSSSCFPNFNMTEIPPEHVYHRISKPVLIGYKGNIKEHQENSIEGLKDAIDRNYQGVHMQVQMTKDDVPILFGENNFLRLTGVDASVRIADYASVKSLTLKKSIVMGLGIQGSKFPGLNKTFAYSQTAKIPLLEDALKAVSGKGVLIYIELVPKDAPPVNSIERDHDLRLGLAVGKMIRRLKLENEVFVVSSDPFKLLTLNHENPNIVTGWWLMKEFYQNETAKSMREEFVDLNGLRDCYIKTAPKGIDFVPFLYETGIVSKSVNSSTLDADFDLIDNGLYINGRTDTTQSILRKNYNAKMSHGAILTFYEGEKIRGGKADDAHLHKILDTGLERIVTDDVPAVNTMLTSILSKASFVNPDLCLILASILLTTLYVR